MKYVMLLLFIFSALNAGEALSTQAEKIRQQADADLAALRLRIAQENTELLTKARQAMQTNEQVRQKLARVNADNEQLTARLNERKKDQEREKREAQDLWRSALLASRLPADLKPTSEKIITAIEQRALRLGEQLRYHTKNQTVIARDGSQLSLPVQSLGQAHHVALGDNHNTRGLLTKLSGEQGYRIAGPPLASIPSGMIAFDASRQLPALSETHTRSVSEWLAAGRFFIWPIIVVFIIGLIIAVERMITLARLSVSATRLLEIANAVANSGVVAAKVFVAHGATPLDRVLRAGLDANDKPRAAREACVEQALLSETSALTRGLPALAVLAGVAPLLGLLGTVTGMIDMFGIIAEQGSGNAKSLSGGISEALVCTQAGMLVAIPLLLLHAWLNRLADRRAQLLEEAACGILGLSDHDDK
jgi:biopolymer transport protein ExbB/TolQ